MAVAGEPPAESALGSCRERRVIVSEKAQRRDQLIAPGTTFERQGTLADGGQALCRIKQRGDPLRVAEPLQSRRREDDRCISAFVELAQACVDVASQRLYHELGIALAQLRLAP